MREAAHNDDAASVVQELVACGVARPLHAEIQEACLDALPVELGDDPVARHVEVAGHEAHLPKHDEIRKRGKCGAPPSCWPSC